MILHIYVYKLCCIDVSSSHSDHKPKLTWTNKLNDTIPGLIDNLTNLQVLNIKNNGIHSNDIVPLLSKIFDDKHLILILKASNQHIKVDFLKFGTDYNYSYSNYTYTITN